MSQYLWTWRYNVVQYNWRAVASVGTFPRINYHPYLSRWGCIWDYTELVCVASRSDPHLWDTLSSRWTCNKGSMLTAKWGIKFSDNNNDNNNNFVWNQKAQMSAVVSVISLRVVGPLQPRGSFRVISRCLLIRRRCHVPLSAVFGPPVTSRASHICVPWLLVASSALIVIMTPAVRVVLVPALAVRVCVASFMVSSPVCHSRCLREIRNTAKHTKTVNCEKEESGEETMWRTM